MASTAFDAERRRTPRALIVATLTYVGFIVYQSLAASGAVGSCSALLGQQGPRLSMGDGIANFVAYLPLGMLAGAWGATRRRPVVMLVAFVLISTLSLSMETLQACLGGRVSSWYDWATNSAGAALGLLLPRFASQTLVGSSGLGDLSGPGGLAARRADQGLGSPLTLPVLLCVTAWLALSLAPWRFTLDVGTIRANLAFVASFDSWMGPDPWRLVRHLAGWLATGCALRLLGLRPSVSTLMLAVLIGVSIASQTVLAWRSLSFDELAGMALALAGHLLLSPFAGTAASIVGLVGCAWISIAAAQLAPVPARLATAPFQWWPQLGRGGLLNALALALGFCWFGLSLVLALRSLRGHERSRDLAPAVWALAGGAAMFILELAQTRIPGRIGDTSAPIIAMLAFVVGWAVTGAPVHQAPRPTSRESIRAAAPLRSGLSNEGRLRGRAATRARRPAS